MDKHLYEITGDMKGLEKLGEEDENLTPEMIKDTMDGVKGMFNDKAIALITVARRFDPDIKYLDEEIKRLQARKKAKVNSKASLIDYLRHNMEETGTTKIECPHFTISLRKGQDVIIVDDADAIDEDYVEIDMVTKVDKKALLKAAKALPEGETMAGCHIEKSKSSVIIK